MASQEGERLRPVWAFLMSSGLRIGELVWLRWSNVDLTNGVVRVVEFASTLGYELAPSSGKSREAVRTVDVDPGLVAVLKLQSAQQSEDRLRSVANYVESDFVFTKVRGGSYHPQRLSRVLGELSVEAGLPRLTAHGLRHTSATLMLASGVPPKVAAERLGHADPTLFTNLYSHATPTMQRDAAEKIGRALFGETQKMAPFHVRDSSFKHESTHMSDVDTQQSRRRNNVYELQPIGLVQALAGW